MLKGKQRAISNLINWTQVAEYIKLLTCSVTPELERLNWRFIQESDLKTEAYCVRGTYVELKSKIEEAQNSGYGIFVMINEIKDHLKELEDTRQTSENVGRLRAIVVDGDGVALPMDFGCTPSFVAKRSATNWHAYWILKDGEMDKHKRWSYLQRKLAMYYSGDLRITDLPRVMRVPGTIHLKTPESHTYVVQTDDYILYSFDDIEQSHKLEPFKEEMVKNLSARSLNGKEFTEDNEETIKFAKELLRTLQPVVRGEGSKCYLYRVACEFRDLGISNDKALEILGHWASSNDQYPNPDHIVMHQINSAYKYAKNEKGSKSIENLYGDLSKEELMEDITGTIEQEAWHQFLRIGKDGELLPSYNNLTLFLEHHPALKGLYVTDLVWQKIRINRETPYQNRNLCEMEDYFLGDCDYVALRGWFNRNYTVDFNLQMISNAVLEISSMLENRVNQLKDYISPLVWDGTPRIETFFHDYLGAKDTAYTREISKLFLVAAVTRVFKPGIKYDHVIILEGSEDKGKTLTLSILGGNYYKDMSIDPSNKDMLQKMSGGWIIEIGEMAGFKKAKQEDVKAFITRQVDEYRVPYGKAPARFPRISVFVATTNDSEYFTEHTGLRRYFIIEVDKALNSDELIRNRDQIFAEAYQCFKEGFPLIPTQFAKDESKRISSLRIITDSWEDILRDPIQEYLEKQGYVVAKDLWRGHLHGLDKDCNRSIDIRLSRLLKRFGLKKAYERVGEKTLRVWRE